MSTHIEWLTARYTNVDSAAAPGVFENDGSQNDVAAIRLTATDGDGAIIEGNPEDLLAIGKRIVNAAQRIIAQTEADPELRRLYGRD